MTQQIGKALASRAIPETGSSVQLTVNWAELDYSPLIDLPARLDDSRLAAVEHIASLPIPAPRAADPDQLMQALRLLSTLPARADDTATGELRIEAFRIGLGELSHGQLNYLAQEAIKRCKWRPSVAECRAILGEYVRRDKPYRAVTLARRAAANERQARYEDILHRLRIGKAEQSEIDGLPQLWRDQFVNHGLLRPDTYEIRPPYWQTDKPPQENDNG